MRKLIAIMIPVAMAMFLVVGLVSLWAQSGPAEKEEDLTAFVREVNPAMAEHIEKVRTINPEEYKKMLGDVSNQYREIKQLEATRPELAKTALEAIKLEARVGELVERYKQTHDTQGKEKLRAEIKTILTQSIDKQIVMQEAQAAYIENELRQLKMKIAQKKQNKDKIVEKRLSDLTAEDYLQWN